MSNEFSCQKGSDKGLLSGYGVGLLNREAGDFHSGCS